MALAKMEKCRFDLKLIGKENTLAGDFHQNVFQSLNL